ncbi:MAG: ComF family protein [Deltaproteobacteria bacterium]|nr:ComF family protein [Deltaproteobacteria bacterium]
MPPGAKEITLKHIFSLCSAGEILRRALDLVYPPRCPVCRTFLKEIPAGSGRPLFCGTCLAGFREITSPLCPICGRPFATGIDEDRVCEDCIRKRPLFEWARAPYRYEGPLMKAIHLFKYQGKIHMERALGPLLASFAGKRSSLPKDALVMPVPLHPGRLRERGFNQSLILARHVAAGLHLELDFLALRRIKYTLPQTGLGNKERRKNVRRAFGLTDKGLVKGRSIILVDDVATTGTTLNECARALKSAGAGEVLCLALARTAIGYGPTDSPVPHRPGTPQATE